MTGSTRERPGGWFPVAVALLTLAPFVPLLIPDDRVIASNEYCDYATYYLPVREFARDEITSGNFPLWIPSLGCGIPLHATQQGALGFPLVTPLIAVLPVNFAMRLCLFVNLALCFMGQYVLARSLGASRPAASFAAIVPTQSGLAIAHLMAGHVNQMNAVGLMPWLFVALVWHLRNATPGSTFFLAIAGALLALSGHPQLPYYAVLTGAFWGAGSLFLGAASRQRLRCLVWTVVTVAIAVSISLFQFLPTLELMRDNAGISGRGAAGYATSFALDGFDLLHFMMPNLRGNPFAGIPDFPSYYFFHERAGYVGLVTLALALFALSRSSLGRWEWGAGALIVLSLVISLGASTPLFGLLGKVLPGLHYFRCPGRILSVVANLAGLLAARGLDSAVSGGQNADRRGIRLLLVVMLLAANGAAYVVVNGSDRFMWTAYVNFARQYLVNDFIASALLALWTGVGFWACLRYGRVAPTCTYGIMIAVLLADLGFFNVANFHLQDQLADEIPEEVLERDPPIRYVEIQHPGRLPASEVRYSKSVPLAIAHRRGMLGTNDGGLLPAATERLFHALEVNLGAALAASACDFEYFPATKSWQPVADVQPRCRFIPEELAGMSKVPLEELGLTDLTSAAKSTNVRPRIVTESSQAIAIELEAPAAGLLVLADSAYPGWRCLVDGTESQIQLVHGVFRGVRVGPGLHHVEFRYRPLSFELGWKFSLLGTVAALLLGSIELVFRKNWLSPGR